MHNSTTIRNDAPAVVFQTTFGNRSRRIRFSGGRALRSFTWRVSVGHWQAAWVSSNGLCPPDQGAPLDTPPQEGVYSG